MSKPPTREHFSPARRPLPAVAIFSRAAVPGAAKTRLIPLLGAAGAGDFQAALISDAVRKVRRLTKRAQPYFFLAGGVFPPSLEGFHCKRQSGRDLGERLERAFRYLLRHHAAAVIIGTDSPELPPRALSQALRELRSCSAVLGPCPDGGYFLIGLSFQAARELHGVFRGVRWGSCFAFQDTLEAFLRRGFICSVLNAIADVDRPDDFRRLRKRLGRDGAARRDAPAVWRFVKRIHRGKAPDPSWPGGGRKVPGAGRTSPSLRRR